MYRATVKKIKSKHGKPSRAWRQTSRKTRGALVQRALGKVTLDDFFDDFDAVQVDPAKNDGLEDCEVVLTIGTRGYRGKTGKGHGHAEMDALVQFIEDVGDIDGCVTLLRRARNKTVTCEDKSVCRGCASVLGALGFKASSAETTKYGKFMGKTQWAPVPQIRALLKAYNPNIDLSNYGG